MLWLQAFPWGRWAIAGAALSLALWFEVRPDPAVEHPFAIDRIDVGTPIDETNTSVRKVPAGLFEALPPDPIAIRPIEPGEPILPSATGDPQRVIPTGWWAVALDLPPTARTGDRVRLVLLDTHRTVDGIVAGQAHEETFSTLTGTVAVPPEEASDVAAAAASGRLVVMISTG